jgi:hypothetical protein
MSSINNPTNTTAQSTSQSTHNAGASTGNAIKEGWNKLHVGALNLRNEYLAQSSPSINQGAGEAIRGNINTFADSITNTDESASRNVTEKGINEMRTGQNQGAHVAGVTPVDTPEEIQRRQDTTGNIGLNGETRFTK